MSPLATQGCFRPLCTLARSHGKVEEVCSCQPESNVGSSSGHDVPKHEHARNGNEPTGFNDEPFHDAAATDATDATDAATAAGDGCWEGVSQGRVPTNPPRRKSSEQEVKRIHKENKKNRARQEAAMAIDRLATSSGDPDLIPRSCTILRKVPLAACQSTNKQFFKSTLIPEPFPKKPI